MALNTGTIAGFNYQNITTTATTVVKTGEGIIHCLTFNKPVATGTVTIYDSEDASGEIIGTIPVPANPQPVSIFYDAHFKNGLTIVTGVTAQDITISYV